MTTFEFNELFENYDEWKSFVQENSTIVDFSDEIQSNFDKFCYTLLQRHFTHQQIRYVDPMAFFGELLNVYENKFKQFLKQKEIIDKMYSLTEDELIQLSTTLSNFANNPNEDVDDPTLPLPFISNQNYAILTSNKLKAYVNALNSIPNLNVYRFIKSDDKNEIGFQDLFINVIGPIDYYYEKGEN